MKTKQTQFIVVYCDQDCLHIPMTWDEDCEGALCCSSVYQPAAVFSSRTTARTAIKVSTAFAKLCKAQGKIANDDFLSSIKNIHIQPLSGKEL